jgi:ATP-binding cassette subfamily C protein
MALLQVMGVASILPFMQIVAEPQVLQQNEWLQWIQEQLGFHDARSMLIATGFVVFFLILAGNVFSAFTVWLQHKYAWEIAHNISTRLLHSYLHRPYEYFLRINSSILLNKILVEVGRFTKEVLIQLIEFSARSMTVLVIFLLLVWVDPMLAFIALGAFGGAYLITFVLTRSYLSNMGNDRTLGNERLLKTLSEALSGIKTVKIYEAESLFYGRFEAASSRLIRIHPRVKLISDTPRYLIEILAFGGILGIILYMLIKGESVQKILPVLSLYALAGYKLLPALQKAFAAASTLRHSFNSVEKIHQDLTEASYVYSSTAGAQQETSALVFQHNVSIKNVSFNYGEKSIFNHLNIKIEKGTTVAFVGSTGSGKTTLINLIVGLLEPQQGLIQIDNTVLERSGHGGHVHYDAYPEDRWRYSPFA